MADPSVTLGTATKQEHFERIYSREPFKGLKAILDGLSHDHEALCDAVHATNSYADLLVRLGYRITLTKQIHVQDSFSHLGPAGGVKVVLPYYDIPTHSSFPTLINYDSTLTTTARSATFFNEMLSALKRQLSTE